MPDWFVIVAAVVAVLPYLGKLVLEQAVTRKFEQFRVELQRDASEHRIRFSRLHELRAEALFELHGTTSSGRERRGKVCCGIGRATARDKAGASNSGLEVAWVANQMAQRDTARR